MVAFSLETISVRVLHVSQPGDGGVARVVSAIASRQVDSGFDVHVAGLPDSDLTRWLDPRVSLYPWSAQRGPGLSTAGELRALRRILQSTQPDLVHLHSSKAGLTGRLALRGRKPTVFQPHGWSWHAASPGTLPLVVRWERLALRWTDVMVNVSSDERRDGILRGVSPERSRVVVNGVDTELFHQTDRKRARNELGMGPGPVVLFVGRFDHAKGPDLLVRAWSRVRKDHQEAELVMVGEGPMFDDIEKLSRGIGGIRLIGFREDVPLWYSAADLVAIPSRWEGMALCALEAMACARSVVGFDVPGFAECLGAERSPSPVVGAGDWTALAAAIDLRLSNAAIRDAEGAANLLQVTEHHNVETVHRNLLAIYEGALQLRGTGARGVR